MQVGARTSRKKVLSTESCYERSSLWRELGRESERESKEVTERRPGLAAKQKKQSAVRKTVCLGQSRSDRGSALPVFRGAKLGATRFRGWKSLLVGGLQEAGVQMELAMPG